MCGSPSCRGFINFDLSDRDAALVSGDSEESALVRARLDEYVRFLHSIGQEQVEETVLRTLRAMQAKLR